MNENKFEAQVFTSDKEASKKVAINELLGVENSNSTDLDIEASRNTLTLAADFVVSILRRYEGHVTDYDVELAIQEEIASREGDEAEVLMNSDILDVLTPDQIDQIYELIKTAKIVGSLDFDTEPAYSTVMDEYITTHNKFGFVISDELMEQEDA